MSLKSDPFTLLPDRHFFAQLLQNFVLLLVASLLILAHAHNGVGAWSFAAGAVVSAANFWLLSVSIPKLVRPETAGAALMSRTGNVVRRALIEFLLRYVGVGVVAYGAIHWHWVHLEAFAMGLSLPIFGIMIQGLRLVLARQSAAADRIN